MVAARAREEKSPLGWAGWDMNTTKALVNRLAEVLRQRCMHPRMYQKGPGGRDLGCWRVET